MTKIRNREPEGLPRDDWNSRLIENVHPASWSNPEPASKYNLVVIGGGSAGLITAAAASGLGARVALIEEQRMGGDCLNAGCVPSKALIRSSRIFADMRRAEEYGAHGNYEPDINFAAVMERMRKIRSGISTVDSVGRYAGLGVDVFLGRAAFTGPREVAVNGTKLRFSKAVIAAGGRAALPDVAGLQEHGCLTNENLFDLTSLPAELVVIGGGPVGCEMAQAFRRFGSRVTILHQGSQLLQREDPDAADILHGAFQAEGIQLVPDAKLLSVKKREGKRILRYSSGNEEIREISCDEILAATGRIPNTEEMGLEKAGVTWDERRGVHVDDFLRTSNRNIFAAGDICLGTKFTHAAEAAAKIVVRNALFAGGQKFSDLVIPWCTYTDPEIAHVGLYAMEAKKQGMEVDTFIQPFSEIDRAITDGREEGFVKVHVKRGTDRILGGTVVGAHAGELISELTMAIARGTGLGKFADIIQPYPTFAEAFKKLGYQYNRTRLTPAVKGLFRLLMAWGRR